MRRRGYDRNGRGIGIGEPEETVSMKPRRRTLENL
jgi:hypothetical protein